VSPKATEGLCLSHKHGGGNHNDQHESRVRRDRTHEEASRDCGSSAAQKHPDREHNRRDGKCAPEKAQQPDDIV
jgi:hypothetical protein